MIGEFVEREPDGKEWKNDTVDSQRSAIGQGAEQPEARRRPLACRGILGGTSSVDLQETRRCLAHQPKGDYGQK